MKRSSIKSYTLPEPTFIPEKSSIHGDVIITDLQSATASTDALVGRGNWGSPVEFVLACMNYALGLGNVWRFPYLCFRNGGGAFLVPYILMVFLVGLPVFFAELFIGQYSGLGPIKAFQFLAPLFKGLGYCATLTTAFVAIYYMMIISWVIFYMWTAFFPSLVWGSCENSWNSDDCFSIVEDIKCQEGNNNDAMDRIYYMRECRTVTEVCGIFNYSGVNVNSCSNLTNILPITDVVNRTLAAEEFFYDRVLNINGATWTQNWGWPQGHLVLCLAFVWILAFICLFKGVKSVGKIVYFTATFPYVILTALLIRAITLEGSITGIKFFITPEWTRLQSPGVWGDAASQVFFSFSLAWGALIVFASYNKFSNNCHFDAVFVSILNFGTALYNGVVVFAILGFLANTMNVSVQDVTSSGPGLTFITYPEAILLMPLPQLWAILFFFMMLILGLGSQFGSIQMLSSSIVDQWPHLREHEWRATAGVCIACFIAALPLTCNGGIYLQSLIEWHTASWNLFLIGIGEVAVLSWVYGINRTLDNILEMGMKLWKLTRYYWKSVWVFITPVMLTAIFIFMMTDLQSTVFREYVFPKWADAMGYVFGLITLVPFVVFFIIELIDIQAGRQTWKGLLKPSDKWGPQEVDGKWIDRGRL
ncbi:CLUMA_CG015093, isoform A [Clunio marinus]|uniref:Transporter n=1 Tax=Clunio marinus TaxID=568069 RepID=A0A1J1IQ76_9DIPT|nr:CLUMA_CG015093, isoform A [Clunio marinus]